MKKLILGIIFCGLYGCSLHTAPKLNTPLAASPGESVYTFHNSVMAIGFGAPSGWDLLYSGSSGDKIKFVYKEIPFHSSKIAQAMNLPGEHYDLEFDVSKDKEVHFKEVSFKVLDHSNSKLTYELIQIPEGK